MGNQSGDSGHHATALDFVTRTGHEPAPASSEIALTLRELRDYFSEADIIEGLAEVGIAQTPTGTRGAVLQALRAYSVLIMESDRPLLTAKLVGKLCKLDISQTGRHVDLEELAREWGMTKQAISKQQSHYADKLGIPRPDSTPEARESHRLMNKRNYGARPTLPIASR